VLGLEDVFLLAAVVALPWFWGGVGLDAYRTAAAVIALAAGWALVCHGVSGLGLEGGAAWLLPAFLLGAFAFAQTIPLPRAWVTRLSPKAAAVQAESFGPMGLDAAGWLRRIEDDARARVPEAATTTHRADALDPGPNAPAPPRRFTLSLLPGVTLERAFWYTALLLAFLLVHRRSSHKGRAAVYRGTLFLSFGVLAVAGVLNHLTSPASLLWMRDAPVETRPFGPYVNPSHFAGVMELAVPWLLGYGLVTVRRTGEPDRIRAGRVLALVGAGICASAAVLAASKLAVATISVACVILIGVAIAGSRGRARMVLLAGTAAAALLFCALALSGPLRGRISDFAAVRQGEVPTNYRGLAWSAGCRLAADYRWTGSGFGTLGEALPAYLPRGESGYWAQLHNDYLEVYVVGGLVAVALLSWLAATFAHRLWRVALSDAGSGRLLPRLGLVLGLSALAAHEFVDFNLQIPANALLFVVVAAMSVTPIAPAESAA
jgi:hypothetical protein